MIKLHYCDRPQQFYEQVESYLLQHEATHCVILGSLNHLIKSEHRGKGYATSSVAALSQILLNQGRKYCFLFADLDNPIPNRIYQNIGYQSVCSMQEYSFL
jgi:RimJ/RimL family protein N-acetyltransferase